MQAAVKALKLAGHVIVLLLWGTIPWIAGSGRRRARFLQWWHRGLARTLGLKIRVAGKPHRGPFMMVANHVSWLDIPAILTGARLLARDPVLGANAPRAGGGDPAKDRSSPPEPPRGIISG